MSDRRGVAAVLAGALLAAPAVARADLLRWTDDDGVVRYTNDVETIPPAFRDRARDLGSSRVREAPVAAAAPAEADPRVIPFSAGAAIVTPARLNGIDLSLMVDTGADRTVISPAAVARAGYGGEPGRVIAIVGVTGTAAAREIPVPLLDVAGTRVGPLRVIVHEVAAPGVDGLLGRDVLDYFTLTVDTARGRAVLVPR